MDAETAENHSRVDEVVRLLDEAGIAYKNVRALGAGVRIEWPNGWALKINQWPTSVERLQELHAQHVEMRRTRAVFEVVLP